MKIVFTFFVLGMALFLVIPGCSPSSGDMRYSSERATTSDSDWVNRYGKSSENLKPEEEEIGFDYRFTPEADTNLIACMTEEDEEYLPVEADEQLNASIVLQRFGGNEETLTADLGTKRELVMMEIIKLLNTPYKYGGNTTDGIDCSAFTQRVYKNALNFLLERSARYQFTQGVEISSKEELQFGDLIFFDTRRRVRPGHVGIYLFDNLFAHASSKRGVIVSSMESGYYSRKYMGARRFEELF